MHDVLKILMQTGLTSEFPNPHHLGFFKALQAFLKTPMSLNQYILLAVEFMLLAKNVWVIKYFYSHIVNLINHLL